MAASGPITGESSDIPARELKDSTICKHCHMDIVNHAIDGKCLFEASSFSPMRMKELIDHTLGVMEGSPTDVP